MLIGLTQPLKAGDKFPLTLTFQKAGKIEVSVHVTDMSGKQGAAAHQHRLQISRRIKKRELRAFLCVY